MKSNDDRNDVDIYMRWTENKRLFTSYPCSTTTVLYLVRIHFNLLGMQASRPPTSFWDSFTDTVYLLFNTPLVEPGIPKGPITIPLKALPALHTPFSRRTVLDDLESAPDPPAST